MNSNNFLGSSAIVTPIMQIHHIVEVLQIPLTLAGYLRVYVVIDRFLPLAWKLCASFVQLDNCAHAIPLGEACIAKGILN